MRLVRRSAICLDLSLIFGILESQGIASILCFVAEASSGDCSVHTYGRLFVTNVPTIFPQGGALSLADTNKSCHRNALG